MNTFFKKIPLINKIIENHENKKIREYNKSLINDIEEVKRLLESVNTRFNMFSDVKLIESTIYEEHALRARYAYLLELARERKVCI